MAPAPQATGDTEAEVIADLSRENGELRYSKDIAEIRADVLAEQSIWYEILTAILMGGFGLIITVAVVFFGLKFGGAALAEARATIAEAKADLEVERFKVTELLHDAETAVNRIKNHETRAAEAAELMEGAFADEPPQDEEKRRGLREIAKDALEHSRIERTMDDYRALVTVASMDKDWEAMERRASAMIYLFEDDDDETLAWAMFAKGYAISQQGRVLEAISAYDEFILRFEGGDTPALQEQVAMALVNKGINLDEINRHDDAIAAYARVIERFGDSDLPDLQDKVARAMVNLGYQYGRQKKYKEELSAYEEAASFLEDVQNPETIDLLNFNLACSHARFGRVEKSIKFLKQWRASIGELDCVKIATDEYFDKIRDRPTFRKFLEDNGCDPDAEPDDNPDPEPAAGPDSD